MKRFKGWDAVAQALNALTEVQRQVPDGRSTPGWRLDEGQCDSLDAIASRIGQHGLLLADEVGMGKTRIAVALAKAVVDAGGRVAVLVPPGLGYQWQDELSHGGLDGRQTLRSLSQYLNCWKESGKRWFDQPVVLVSHAFTNWRLGGQAETWRWTLLPELYAQWQKHSQSRFPHHYRDGAKKRGQWEKDDGKRDKRVARAAKDIVELAAKPGHKDMRALLDELIKEVTWKEIRDSEAYGRQDALRERLEASVGLGLGSFNLVIIDEAHKSRGDESGLTRLLERVISSKSGSRRLSMTATPVELGIDQWHQALQRIDIEPGALQEVKEAIETYARCVSDVRKQPSQESARAAFKVAATQFHCRLSPYLLRRDKRESQAVRRFWAGTKKPIHAYREESQISIETAKLPNCWRQAICAAEALSLLAGQDGDTKAQRLRLTLGNGHGINSVLDTWAQRDAAGEESSEPEIGDKAAQRIRWWQQQLVAAFAAGEASLYEHPGILAAVGAIEDADAEGEKVLVFGRFTRPMKALVELLNARAMLRHLDAARPWPQAKIHEDEWPAVQAAHRQLGKPGVACRAALDIQLEAQYDKLEKSRERLRADLLRKIGEGLEELKELTQTKRDGLSAVLSKSEESHAALTKALSEVLGDQAENETPRAWARAFADLVAASSDRDEGDGDGDGSLDDAEANELWTTLAQRLNEEYNRPQGGFARLMQGDTKPPTRRLLQMAFNRAGSFPRVLVAQSVVGREGLNLHRACRTVVLLHPEWNPGVVEQQIGRVDRIGSRWEQQLNQAIESNVPPEDWPRIRIWPVVFKGTYDEKNWSVLRQRWDELRSQLHGVVIPESARCGDASMEGWIDEINAAAPNFSPRRKAPMEADSSEC